MGRTKNIDRIYSDLEDDFKKISKRFNKDFADYFFSVYLEEANNWYQNNTPSTTTDDGSSYERTGQLASAALVTKKEGEYSQKISFSADKIRPEKRGEGKLPAYYSFMINSKKNRRKENIASDVLYWEEMGYWNFAQYNYKRGHGIFGTTLNRMIKEVDSLKPPQDLKVYLSDNIVNDLYELLKKKTKAIMQKRYVEIFY